jgi:hypothetical protein
LLYTFNKIHRIKAPTAKPIGRNKIGSHMGPIKYPNNVSLAEKIKPTVTK